MSKQYQNRAETNDNEIAAYLRGAVLPILTNVRDILHYEDDTHQLPIGLRIAHSIPLSDRRLPSTTHGVCRLLHVRNIQAIKALEKLLEGIYSVEVSDEGTTIVKLGNEVEILIQDQVSYIRWQTTNKSGTQLHEMRVDAENPSVEYTLNTSDNKAGWYTHRIQLNEKPEMNATYRNIAIAKRRVQLHRETTTYTKENSREKALLEEVYTVLEQVSGSVLLNECFITRKIYYMIFESGVGVFQDVDHPSMQLTYRTVEAQVRVVISNNRVEIYRESFGTDTKVDPNGDPKPRVAKTIISLSESARDLPQRLSNLNFFQNY